MERNELIQELIAAEKLGSDRSPEARMGRVLDVILEELNGIKSMIDRRDLVSLVWSSSAQLVEVGEQPSLELALESMRIASDSDKREDKVAMTLHAIATLVNLMLEEMEDDEEARYAKLVTRSHGKLRPKSARELQNERADTASVRTGRAGRKA